MAPTVRATSSTVSLHAPSAQSLPKDQSVRFGFSAGGLLFPFYVGVCKGLETSGYLSANTKLAGASAGSLIAACVNSGLSMDTVSQLCEDLMDDCRKHGTRGRLGVLLETFLQDALPEDAHIRCDGKTFVAVSSVGGSRGRGFSAPTGQLVSTFKDREDFIQALLTSCHIPLWMDGRLTSTFRGTMHLDGGVTNFIPLPPDDGTPGVRVSCFGAKQMGLVYDIGIAPDIFDEWPHSLPTMVQWAFNPAEEHFQKMLVDRGECDALSWAAKFEAEKQKEGQALAEPSLSTDIVG
jgi:hypothetical protein